MARKTKVLFVDDDEVLAETVRETLERMGYEARAETDPRKVLREFAKDPASCDAVIVDHLMPGMKGIELARWLSCIRDDLPLVLLTGHPDMIRSREVEHANIRAVLFKPVTPTELSSGLEVALSNRRNGNEKCDSSIKADAGR